MKPFSLLFLFLNSVAVLANVTDFRGRILDEKTERRKIVALMPSLAEMVVDLGAESRLVGAPEYSRLPKNSQAKILGPYNQVPAEPVYALKPDLVIASMDGNPKDLVWKLEALKLDVFVLSTNSIEEILNSATLLAKLLGKGDHPKLALLKHALLEKTPPSKKRVFMQVGWNPIVSVAKGTFIDELVTHVGATNIFHDAPTKYPRPNPEEVIALNPDTIILCQLTDSGEDAKAAKEFWSRFKKIDAVRNNRVIIFPKDILTKPGFDLVQAVGILKKTL